MHQQVFLRHNTIKTSGTVYANVFPEEQNKTESQKKKKEGIPAISAISSDMTQFVHCLKISCLKNV